MRSAALILVTCVLSTLTGCTLATTAPPASLSGATIHGTVHGGQQPLAGASVYLYAAGTGAYGNPSVSLLNSNVLTNNPGASGQDGIGNYYITTDSNGSFTITNDYTCTSGQQVYLYVRGGDPGTGSNSSSSLLAILGNCPGGASSFVTSIPTLTINEVTTVAAAYAFAGFATDPTHVSSSGTPLALQGIANAFANAGNLASLPTGSALATTPAGNGTAPQTTVNTLANILAACINSPGTVTGPTNPTACYTLFTNALSAGATGSQPSDTATAAINIAHYPGANAANLYGIVATSTPFAPALANPPNDFTLGINFTGGGLAQPKSLAIDGLGNVWVQNFFTVSEFSSLGAALSGNSGFTSGLDFPTSLAIDTSNNVWVTNGIGTLTGPETGQDVVVFSNAGSGSQIVGSPYALPGNSSGGGIAFDMYKNAWFIDQGNDIVELSGTGTPAANSPFTPGNLQTFAAKSLAVDGSGNVWVPNMLNNRISKFSNAGTLLSANNGYSGGGLALPFVLALDKSGDVWALNSQTTGSHTNAPSTISELSNTGTSLQGTLGLFWPALTSPTGIAIDGAGDVWISNYGTSTINYSDSSIFEFSNSGSLLSTYNGYKGSGTASTLDGIAIDGSGDAWMTDNKLKSLLEVIGVAVPVITPIAAGLPATPTSDGSSNLGTRP
jgi:hypothetical protein